MPPTAAHQLAPGLEALFIGHWAWHQTQMISQTLPAGDARTSRLSESTHWRHPELVDRATQDAFVSPSSKMAKSADGPFVCGPSIKVLGLPPDMSMLSLNFSSCF